MILNNIKIFWTIFPRFYSIKTSVARVKRKAKVRREFNTSNIHWKTFLFKTFSSKISSSIATQKMRQNITLYRAQIFPLPPLQNIHRISSSSIPSQSSNRKSHEPSEITCGSFTRPLAIWNSMTVSHSTEKDSCV